MNSPYGLALAENCLVCRVRSESFFCALPRPALEAFERIRYASSYPERAIVFLEGQAPRGIFLLCQGQAKLSATASDGHTLILRIAKPGEVLGLHATITGKPYELTVETMQPCQLNFVKREDFLRFLKEHGDACLHAVQHLSHDCSAAYSLIRSIGLSHSMSERIARLLLEVSEHARMGSGVVRVRLALTHDEIAEQVGCSRETITRTLADFKRNGVAELKGSILTIRNKAALERLIAA